MALNSAFGILDINEGCLSHASFGHHSSGNGNFLSVHFFKPVFNVLAVSVDIPLFNQIGIPSRFLQIFQLFSPDSALFTQSFFCQLFRVRIYILVFLLFTHSYYLWFLTC